ncbi:unnamed protein product, partial [Prorocentrum cordatum]
VAFGGADRISTEIESLLDNSKWSDILDEFPDLAPRSVGLIRRGVLKVHGMFTMRIVSPSKTFPQRLLCLAMEPAAVPHELRKDIARTLVESDSRALHRTAAKIKALFEPELRECMLSGKLSASLWAPIHMVGQSWKGDTQEIEGINNVIQVRCDRAPRIGMGLLDARVGLRKELGLGSRQSRHMKWSEIAPHVEAMVRDSMAHASGVNGVLATPDRWTPPPEHFDDVRVRVDKAILGVGDVEEA